MEKMGSTVVKQLDLVKQQEVIEARIKPRSV